MGSKREKQIRRKDKGRHRLGQEVIFEFPQLIRELKTREISQIDLKKKNRNTIKRGGKRALQKTPYRKAKSNAKRSFVARSRRLRKTEGNLELKKNGSCNQSARDYEKRRNKKPQNDVTSLKTRSKQTSEKRKGRGDAAPRRAQGPDPAGPTEKRRCSGDKPQPPQ